jgi:hypothetical protein
MKPRQLLLLILALTSCQAEDIGVGIEVAVKNEPEIIVPANPNAKGKVKNVAFTGDTTVTLTYFPWCRLFSCCRLLPTDRCRKGKEG